MFHLFRWGLLAAAVIAGRAAESPHAAFIRGFDDRSLSRGKDLYDALCITCHGSPALEGSIPTSRPFWKEPFKNGGDPYSLFKTLTDGMGQMPALAVLTPQQRYDAIHYLRETFVRPHNPQAYFKVDEAYLASLPLDPERLEVTDAMLAAEKGPVYLRMDFGPALFWTYQVASNNIAYKGLAIRLDDGAGGISKDRAWMLYDHDTMRVAAAWKGTNFIDWRGIAFDGSHGTHASIVGEKIFVNPPGPGWGDPANGQFKDTRSRGRDEKPHGPLPRHWAHYRGAYYHSNRVVLSYTVGSAEILELPSMTNGAITRTLNISKSPHDLILRAAPVDAEIAVSSPTSVQLIVREGFHNIRIPATATPAKISVTVGGPPPEPIDLSPLIKGGPPRWPQALATAGRVGSDDGPFAIDEILAPPDAANPWRTWMRYGGFDFFADGQRAAICTWNGDVWLVSGLDRDLRNVIWKRIASGLFQPLGVKIVQEKIYVTCRDQIARLHDLNGDDEIDFVENFNNDHQVTEHFHEFAMGLQTDREGNFYYAKSARHALPAVVPHHGTLLKVSRDGAKTEIVANGFRAANGVCVNDDGTFFVTDQEGHWTPKNRINWVRPGRFYGNMMGYHKQPNEEMDPPLVWITNEMDRSPGELVRIPNGRWGPLQNSLLNLSYGTGRVFLVPHDNVGGQMQGAVVQLPIPDFPTGVMRGRFHPSTGDLYACGMYAWAGNRQQDGGFYRIRATGKPSWLPIQFRVLEKTLVLTFSDRLDTAFAVDPTHYTVKTWSLRRSANYGSKHHDEKSLAVTKAELETNQRTLWLKIPDLGPTQSLELRADLRSATGEVFQRTIHATIHAISMP